jgi:cell division transport system permease protein
VKAFKFTKRNIRRTPYQALAASMVMFLTFLILILFLLLAVGSQKILQHYESKPQAIAFFKDNTTVTDVKAIENALMQTGKVTTLKFVSNEEALEIYRERNRENPALLELVSANILPSSLEVSTLSPNDLAPIAEILRREPVVDQVIYPEDVIQSLTRATSIVRTVGAVAVGFLIIFAFLVIVMVIGFKIRIRRTEIEIMKLLGASNWFIRAPFLLEGIYYGMFGAISAWIVSYALIWYFTPFMQPALAEIALLPVSPLIMLALLGISAIIALIIGGLGSFGAVRRYLRI